MNQSSGIGDPYWYEWGLGLIKAVEMLNPDSGIEQIAFQKEGIKGWDDVIVKFSSGHYHYYQIKHSRPRTNLTFSDLVGSYHNSKSLLNHLSSAWLEMRDNEKNSRFILLTNRKAGSNSSHSNAGVYYPPLEEFIRLVSRQVNSASTLAEVVIPDSWSEAWSLWLDEMAGLPENKFRFLKQLDIRTDAYELEELRKLLATSLAENLQIKQQQAKSLVEKLISRLLDWTTSMRSANHWVTVEDVMGAISEDAPVSAGYCEIPSPEPFFPSREKCIEDICSLLTGDEPHKIVFLQADPGSGKTSVISRIVNQRATDYSTMVVDLRYYAYKPMSPDSPTLPADADSAASAKSLWYALLSQIRIRLKGRLHQLRVPVQNILITPDEARDHVLRLASILSNEKRSPFVIAIDGIDHAARASRKNLPSLLASLPPPEAIPNGVRFLIAGQPANGYSEYPSWLKAENQFVTKISLPPVLNSDIEILLLDSSLPFTGYEYENAVRIIHQASEGNTLATVFAVAEAKTCISLTELADRLQQRKLHCGVHEYYNEIWQAAIKNCQPGIGKYISSALCLLRERVTGELMTNAFALWNLSAPEWNEILSNLEPLVISEKLGYRVRHNDIRVFLEQELRSDIHVLEKSASLLSDYYRRPSAPPLIRQQSLFTLLELAKRENDKARVFTPEWVVEAAAHSRNLSAIYQEAEDAFRAIPEVKDWDVALSVACGGMTLAKLTDCIESFPDLLGVSCLAKQPVPICFEYERYVLPIDQWNVDIIEQLLQNVQILSDEGQTDRARGLLLNWLSDLSPAEVVGAVKGMTNDEEFDGESPFAFDPDTLFQGWGSLCCRLEVDVRRNGCTKEIHHHATYLFEEGWVIELISNPMSRVITSELNRFNPHYLHSFEVALDAAANRCMWNVVAWILNQMQAKRDQLQLMSRLKAAYWALNAVGINDASMWTNVISNIRNDNLEGDRIEIPEMIVIAKLIGWLEPSRTPTTIASDVADIVVRKGSYPDRRAALALPLQAAAMIGLLERLLSKGDKEKAALLLPAETIRLVIKRIWDDKICIDLYEHREIVINQSCSLIKLCNSIGNSHREMVLTLAMDYIEHFYDAQRLLVLWEVLRRAGRLSILQALAKKWIGAEGEAWSGFDYIQRMEIVTLFCKLCRDEEWNEIVEYAEQRLRYNLIGYSTHKEYAFSEALDWVKELFIIDPMAWRREGFDLMELCRVCNDQSGDNRLHRQIMIETATAAFRCGPSEAFAFFCEIDPKTDHNWLDTVRTTCVEASKTIIAKRILRGLNDVLALWSFAVGLTRWFDKNQVQLITELRDTILSAVDSCDRQIIVDQLQLISPGEFLRELDLRDLPISINNHEADIDELDFAEIETLITTLSTNPGDHIRTNPLMISYLVRRIIQKNPAERLALLTRLFAALVSGENFSSRWGTANQSQMLNEIISSLRESERWDFVRAALSVVGGDYWYLSVPHNINLICLYRAVHEGSQQVREGVQTSFSMHRTWTGIHQQIGSNMTEAIDESYISSWPCFAATILTRLLSSESSETISAAIRGLCALSEFSPQEVANILQNSSGIQRTHLLLAAEVWAVRKPQVFRPVLETLWKNKHLLNLSDTIQLWICSLSARHVQDGFTLTETFLPSKDLRQDILAPQILKNTKRLMETKRKEYGSSRFFDVYSIARTWIDRIKTYSDCNTNELETFFAERLAQEEQNVMNLDLFSKLDFGYESGDMRIIMKLDEILDEAIIGELQKQKWKDTGNIALSVTRGDDPWIMRRSPLPARPDFDWPDEHEVNEWLHSNRISEKLKSRLFPLVEGKSIKSGQVVIGSYLHLYGWHYEVEVRHWLELSTGIESVYQQELTCPSSRSFQYHLPDRFEPSWPNRRSLVYFSGSICRHSFSRMDIILAKALQQYFGWTPSNRDPLKWTRHSSPVAFYEHYHGPPNYNSRVHMRQSTLTRWVANEDAVHEIGKMVPRTTYLITSLPES